MAKSSKKLSKQEPGTALQQAAAAPPDEGMVGRLIDSLLALGLDGRGPIDGAAEVAAKALRKGGTTNRALNIVIRQAVLGGAAGGFATSIGGFITMPVAMPVNVFEFYGQATRMVGAIAVLRGYDINDERIRTAVLLTLTGADADEMLRKAGLSSKSHKVADIALERLPTSALMVVNKAIGFRLLRGLGEKAFTRMGRGVPLAGGVLGGGVDGYMMHKIAEHAKDEFPPRM